MSHLYQPRWVDGREVGTGRRDAAGRYTAIAEYLDDARDFTVLDFGAYGGYFSARLADERNATCTAVDDSEHLTGGPKVVPINRRLSAAELLDLGPCDVALCLSVLHHLPDWPDYLDALTTIAPLLFVETAHPSERLPKARAHGDSAKIAAAVEGLGGKVLTTTPGHDARFDRPLWVIDNRPPAEVFDRGGEMPESEPVVNVGEPEPIVEPTKRPRRRRTPKTED
ncbi:class I SAM-dependent methyltransferase [Nocardia rhizosphaerae]|uniref:Class I SAM-dependent methyltransferase n=1 Tax=Nocardia rhizosphaerae TaxID=1691571 RepID=A0ABV8L2L8_9NOCA